MAVNPLLAQFANQQYLNLETYRKDGQAVRTPVWFAEDDGTLFLHTVKNTGKVKRIRRSAQVRVAPCDMVGTITGEWIAGEAHLLDAEGIRRVNDLLDRKYGAAKAEFERRNNLQNVAWDAIEIRI
ncbi:MAG: PPOX class F420-dependent oxidoreductase [Chloroflexi bacterium]|nr:PPOX class F420-dependent oxidoreductase [Chloroflexota bacterium]